MYYISEFICLFSLQRQRAQSLLPVTIAELISATQNEDKFYTGDIEISQVDFFLFEKFYYLVLWTHIF